MKIIHVILFYFLISIFYPALLTAQFNHLWSFGTGTSFSSDETYVMALDHQSNIVISGSYSEPMDFDPGPGEFNLTNVGDGDIFLAKYTPGGELIFAKSASGTAYDQVTSLSIDGQDNIVLCGYFEDNIDIDPSPVSHVLQSNGEQDIFLVKYDSSGNLLFGFHLGGEGGSVAKASVDHENNIYLGGSFQNEMDADPGTDINILTATEFRNVFFAKFDSEGSLIFAKSLEGMDAYYDLTEIAVDKSGNIIISGYLNGTLDFDPGINEEILNSGHEVGYLAKYDNVGELTFVNMQEGSGSVVIRDISFNPDDDIILTGSFSDTVDFDSGEMEYILTATAGANIFLARYDSIGNLKKIVPLTVTAGSNSTGQKILYTDDSDIYLTGSFESDIDFDPGPGEALSTSNGYSDIFLAHYDSDFNYIDAVTMGGSEWEESYSCAVSPEGDVYITGSFSLSADFDPGDGEAVLTSSGYEDIFLAKYSTTPNGTFQPGGKTDITAPTVFPNPATDVVTIKAGTILQQAEVKIYDISGVLLRSFQDLRGNEISLNIKSLPGGMYVIEVRDGDYISKEKVVVWE